MRGLAGRRAGDGSQQVPGGCRPGRQRAIGNDRHVQAFPRERSTDVAALL